jgi:hypothetical protein
MASRLRMTGVSAKSAAAAHASYKKGFGRHHFISPDTNACRLWLLHHAEVGFGEVLAHQRKGLGAAEIVVAGIGRATFP